MASANPPVKGVVFAFETALIAQADTDIFKAGPTLAAGDVLVVKDGVLAGNITSLPVAVTSCTNLITVSLSAAEMNADRITVLFHDAAGDEWQDQEIMIFTSAQTFDATDGIADDIKAIVADAGYGNSALASVVAAIPTTAAPSAADVADAVWDEAVSGHEISTTFGGKLQTAVSSAADIATAVWAATTRTLTSLSALLVSISADVWAYAQRTLTSSAAATTAAVSGSDLAISITASYAATVTGLTIPSTWTKLWFTVKNDKDSETDAQAILQVLVSNPAAGTTDGVQYVMAGAASVAQRTLGSLTPDQAAGTVAIALDETLTAVLAKGSDLDWDIKCLTSAGACTVLTEGECDIARTVTRATS